jgi:uncharacterized membrane protein YeaQ/YmgE (transglycosylase-associated protein family)
MARLEVEEVVAIEPDDGFLPWYVSWSGVFVGALSALALLLVFGLLGISVGAHQIGQRFASWHEFRLITLVFSVFGSFLSFVLGGWAAARVTGTRRPETAMLHGAIAWLVTIPGLLFFAGLGAGGYLGAWYGGLAAPPPWAPQATPMVESAAAALAARNAALGALTALLLGLVGSVVGGWMGSGERMTLNYMKRPYGHDGRTFGEMR